MTTKHEALERLIYSLEIYETGTTFEAAALLRRQHARIEELERMLRNCINAIDNIGGEHVTGLVDAWSTTDEAESLLTKKD